MERAAHRPQPVHEQRELPNAYSDGSLTNVHSIHVRSSFSMEALTRDCHRRAAGRMSITDLEETMNDLSLLHGKRAVVFGAGGSIGAAVARKFAAEGAQVFL